MARPDDLPSFATDTNFTNGPDVGTATKIEPSAGELAEGHIRETAPSAQKENWWKNLVGEWFGFYADEYPQVDVFEGPTSATWTKPVWAKTVQVLCVGGGGGGGGITGATADTGGGGGGGQVIDRTVSAALLGATLAVVAGDGGSGGTAGFGVAGGYSEVSGSTFGVFYAHADGGFPGGTAGGGTGGGLDGGTGNGGTGHYGCGGAGGNRGAPIGGNGGAGHSCRGSAGGVSAVPRNPNGWGGGGAGGSNNSPGTALGGGGGGAFGVGPTGATAGLGSGNKGNPGAVIFISW